MLLTAALATALAGPPTAPPSLCLDGETLAFGCRASKKVLSLCRKGTDVLYYRFGKPGAVELTYPDSPIVSADAFFYDEERIWSGPSGPPPIDLVVLRFERKGVKYEVRQENYEKAGIRVIIEDKPPVDIPCEGKPTGDLTGIAPH